MLSLVLGSDFFFSKRKRKRRRGRREIKKRGRGEVTFMRVRKNKTRL
jgi:hypothetical protein